LVVLGTEQDNYIKINPVEIGWDIREV